jgi:hypothetical protein
MKLPDGIEVPCGAKLPDGIEVPCGTKLPDGIELPPENEPPNDEPPCQYVPLLPKPCGSAASAGVVPRDPARRNAVIDAARAFGDDVRIDASVTRRERHTISTPLRWSASKRLFAIYNRRKHSYADRR